MKATAPVDLPAGSRRTEARAWASALLLAALAIGGCAMPAAPAAGGLAPDAACAVQVVPTATAAEQPRLLELPAPAGGGSRAWRVPADWGESAPRNAGQVTQLLAVEDGDRLWLIGSGPTPRFGRLLDCALQRASGRRVTDIVNTRAHPELAMGNLAFSGARIWALGDVAEAMDRQCADCVERLVQRLGPGGAPARSLAGDVVRVPDSRIDAAGEAQGRLGPFDWWALGIDRGVRTLVLRHRERRLVIAQGLAWVGGIPSLRGARIDHLLPSLERLLPIVQDAQLLGEQGEPGGGPDVDAQRRYWLALRAAVWQSLERGDADPTSADSPALRAWEGLPGHAENHGLNLQRATRELEERLFN